MVRELMSLSLISFVLSCQTPTAMPAKVSVPTRLDRGPQVDAGVRPHQDRWLQGLVLDPDQTGVNTLAVVGDSYSDTGTLFDRTRTLAPPQVFWRSRFSNGPIWVDYVQGATGWAIRSYPFIELDEEPLQEIPQTSLKAQVDRLQKDLRNLNRDEVLISIWIGPDRYREKSHVDAVLGVMDDLRKAIVSLDAFGFHRIAVGNLPDLSHWPLAQKATPARREFLKKVAGVHNEALKAMLDQLKTERLDLRAYVFQAFEIQKTSQEKAESAGVKLKAEACFNGDARGATEGERRFCKQVGATQYWDAMHPTSKLHCFYAAQFLSDTADAEHVGGYNKGQAVDHCQQL